jgi:tRNA A-37 threonylcarbamoyl transferase component Bud32
MIGQLGKYRIDSVLGKGAMGVVYKAFDPLIERTVALKTIRKELFSDSEQADLLGRFKNEAQAAGRLNHPNIVTVYDYGEDREAAYIAMEFVDGTPLNALMTPDQPTALLRIAAWMNDLLLALDYAHSRGVVHRDIKPSNLLITNSAQVKVSDLGIARIESSTMTHTGSVIGTPSYMSPEQVRGETADARSDVFSAGVLLYQLLTGKRPFAGSTAVVMQQILNEQPAPPSQLVPALGTGYDQVVARAMAKSTTQRYPSARAFLDAFAAVGRGARNRARRRRPYRARRRAAGCRFGAGRGPRHRHWARVGHHDALENRGPAATRAPAGGPDWAAGQVAAQEIVGQRRRPGRTVRPAAAPHPVRPRAGAVPASGGPVEEEARGERDRNRGAAAANAGRHGHGLRPWHAGHRLGGPGAGAV